MTYLLDFYQPAQLQESNLNIPINIHIYYKASDVFWGSRNFLMQLDLPLHKTAFLDFFTNLSLKRLGIVN